PAVRRGHLGLALEDDEEADPLVAADDDLRALGVAHLAHLLRELLQLRRGHAVEQADRLQFHAVILKEVGEELTEWFWAGRFGVRRDKLPNPLEGELGQRRGVLP